MRQHERVSPRRNIANAPPCLANARLLVTLSLFVALFSIPARAEKERRLTQSSPSPSEQSQQSQQSPCKSKPEYRQFDFWLGEWDVFTPEGKLAGTNSVQLILGDCVVFENWTGSRGGAGKSFNVYNAAKRKWQQTWVDSFGNVLELSGDYKEGGMRFAGESFDPKDGKRLLNRLTFTKISADKVRQFWEQSNDEGKSWIVVFDGAYARRKSAPTSEKRNEEK